MCKTIFQLHFAFCPWLLAFQWECASDPGHVTQVGEVERLVAKLQQLRSDADSAEERAGSVTEEAKELAQVTKPPLCVG